MTATAENKLYLDYAATTPVRTAVQEAMRPYWQQTFANPQSQHEPGRAAGAAVAAARTDIETALGVKPSEIIFTSGATEANTLAVRGTLQARQQDKRHLMIGANSHPSLLQAQLPEAVSCTQIPLTATGRIDLKALRDAVSPETALISVPYVDSEIGSVQPLKKIARQLTAGGDDNQPLLHADASQAGLYHSLSPELLGVDLMTVNGHKLYGPKGVGFLWVRSGTPLSPVLLSEKQHLVGDYQALRPGTPPTPLIVGLAAAVTWAQDNYRTHRDEVRQVRDYGIRQIKATFPSATINGSQEHRVASNISVHFPETDHDYLSTQLSERGVFVSTTSACQSGTGTATVLSALPGSADQALRITLGVDASQEQVDRLLGALKAVVAV